MHPFPPPELMEPLWFFPFFAAMWCGISALLAMLGGWAWLARSFKAEQSTQGKRFRFVSGSMGASVLPVSYSGCLFITVGETGFRLSILFLFRLLSPPLFIPWRAIESVESRRLLLSRRTVIRIRDRWPTISIRGEAGEELQRAYAGQNRSNAL